MMSDFSELCKACQIFNICHEPQKYTAESCHHFKGTPPQGYLRIDGGVCNFVENHWKGNKGYFVRTWGREWVDQTQFDWKKKYYGDDPSQEETKKRSL